MNFNELVHQRHSQRSYDPERAIPSELLNQILETARWAPSAANRQPWQILVIQNPTLLNRIHAAYPRDWFMDAPCVLVVKGWRTKAWSRPYDAYNSLETDLAILMDHLTLAACEHGLGSCWIANFDLNVLSEALSLPSDETVFCISPLGYSNPQGNEIRQSQRKDLSEIVVFL